MIIRTSTDLRCHPATPCSDTRALKVRVLRTSNELELRFLLEGNISGIRLVPGGEAKALGELWRHTCFEAFISIEGQQAYREFNFAPSGEWRAYVFHAYRNPAPLTAPINSVSIEIRTSTDRFELDARLSLRDLSRFHCHSPLCLGLSAVIEKQDGSLSFWAIRHSTARPDFHRPEAFALRLGCPDR